MFHSSGTQVSDSLPRNSPQRNSVEKNTVAKFMTSTLSTQSHPSLRSPESGPHFAYSPLAKEKPRSDYLGSRSILYQAPWPASLRFWALPYLTLAVCSHFPKTILFSLKSHNPILISYPHALKSSNLDVLPEVSKLLESLLHTGRGVVLGHTLNTRNHKKHLTF